MMFEREIPYNNLPSLPPNIDVETKAVLLKTITASRALAQLNGAIVNLPNLTLFLDTIHLQEAKASSEIENIVTTNDELYKTLVSESHTEDNGTKEVLMYKEAIWLGLENLKKKPFITTNLCIKIVQCIKQNTAAIRNTPGTKLKNGRGTVIYTPPEGEDIIIEKLTNWEKFINTNQKLDPLIKMAIMHYQFEAIHPFIDGNGRTGRIMLLLYLKISNLLNIPALYFSEYIIKHKSSYYKNLQQVTEHQNWEPYLLYMLDMVEVTALQSIKQMERISKLMETTALAMQTQLPKVYSRELIEILFRLPYTKRQVLIDAKLGTAKTVGNYLSLLEEYQFLTSVKVGKEKLYINSKLLALLENH